MNPERVVQLRINEQLYTVPPDINPSTTLNAYIRDYALAKGTKYMCQEGGCGACIVTVKRINSATQKQETFGVNSCLVPVYSCHGWSIITIEGIGNRRNGFHKVQLTLAGFNGTQCGYCSPGMVMNMFSLLNSGKNITMKDVENSFGSNICRCTGYRSILDAFKSLASDATPELKRKCADIEDLYKEGKICPKTNEGCNNTCHKLYNKNNDNLLSDISNISIKMIFNDNTKWFRVTTIKEIYEVFETTDTSTKYMLLAGHTSNGVYRIGHIDIYIDINAVSDLHTYTVDPDTGNLILGANVSLTRAITIFKNMASEKPDKYAYLEQLANHIELVANVPVRNIGTLAGNLSIKYNNRNFPSDIFIILEAVKTKLTIGHITGIVYEYSLQGYLQLDMYQRLIINIILPPYDSSYVYGSYKIMQRAQNTHADVNSAFLVKVNKNDKFRVLETPNIVFGGINTNFIHATNTETYLNGKQLLNISVLKEACTILKSEVKPDSINAETSPLYRQSLAVNLFYKFILSLSPDNVSTKYKSGGTLLERPLSSGKQDFQTEKLIWPITKPIPKLEAFLQCSGEAEFVNDIPAVQNQLYAAVVLTRTGPGLLDNIDTSLIKNMPGVVKFLSAKDIPGKNIIISYTQVEIEELFAEKEIKFSGQPVGVVIATTQQIANVAAERVVVKVNNQQKPVLDLREVAQSGDKNRISIGATKPATTKKTDIKLKLNGSLLVGSQYHYTMETHTCFCIPTEDGIDVFSATQDLHMMQNNVAAVLAVPLNSVFVRTKRVGGGYGAKLIRSALVTSACALASNNLKVPVRSVMTMESNMEAIGKRFPMYGQYEIAINEKGVIQYANLNTYSNMGKFFNDTICKSLTYFGPVLYEDNVWDYKCYAARLDIPSNTYCRSPGSTEIIALNEYIMEHIAHEIKQDPVSIRLANIKQEHYSVISTLIADLKKNSDFDERKTAVDTFNNKNRWKKRGITLVPMCYAYDINMKYSVLLSVYAGDGTIALTHGGVEIGQGINTKVVQACAYTLGIDMNMIRVTSTNTITAPNNSGTGGSVASDSVTIAVIECCKILLQRLDPIKKKYPNLNWKDLINKADAEFVDLCCEYMYSPIVIPRKYNIYGVVVTEVEIDLLTGQHQIVRVDLLEDAGQSISPLVDIGQVEGAFVMGLGYYLNEKLIYDSNTGNLLTNRSWNYTPPGAKDIPIDFRVYFRRDVPNHLGILRSKATGEPPLCLSVSVVFAIRNALASGRKDATGKDEWFEINLPYTPENILLSAETTIEQFSL